MSRCFINLKMKNSFRRKRRGMERKKRIYYSLHCKAFSFSLDCLRGWSVKQPTSILILCCCYCCCFASKMVLQPGIQTTKQHSHQSQDVINYSSIFRPYISLQTKSGWIGYIICNNFYWKSLKNCIFIRKYVIIIILTVCVCSMKPCESIPYTSNVHTVRVLCVCVRACIVYHIVIGQ